MQDTSRFPYGATAWLPALALAAGAASAPALADPERDTAFQLDEYYGLGIAEHDLDDETEVIGWRLNRSWYFGREDRQDSVSLVWQGNQDRVSISVDEIRFTRRF